MLRLLIATLAGRAAGRLSQLFGRGGSALPGLVAERLDPRTIEKLVAGLPEGVVVVTGTNGKTTTTKMLVGILEAAGKRVVSNPTGSNLARGVATRLIQAASLRGRVEADAAVFEVDEAAVRTLGARLRPRAVLVTNLARDQLDRYGELNTTAAHIGAAIGHADAAVLNADDPLVAGLADTSGRVRHFGAADAIRATVPDDRSMYGGGGGQPSRPPLDLRLAEVESAGESQRVVFEEADGRRLHFDLRLPGVFNAYNAAAAALTARELGVDLAGAVETLAAVDPAWGRGQLIDYSGRQIRLLLVKNPAGFNQAIRLLREAEEGSDVLIAINDNVADGHDVSWLWDARVEGLAGTGHRFVTSGIRADDMALRLKYAGVTARWSEPDFGVALDRFAAEAGEREPLFVVPTYTAMLSLLELLLPDTHRREAWT